MTCVWYLLATSMLFWLFWVARGRAVGWMERVKLVGELFAFVIAMCQSAASTGNILISVVVRSIVIWFACFITASIIYCHSPKYTSSRALNYDECLSHCFIITFIFFLPETSAWFNFLIFFSAEFFFNIFLEFTSLSRWECVTKYVKMTFMLVLNIKTISIQVNRKWQ